MCQAPIRRAPRIKRQAVLVDGPADVQETDPQQRPSRSPLSDMGLAKAWKKRDDKLNPSGKQCGNRGSGSKKQLSARPKRCDAPSLFPPGLAADHNHPVRVASSANRKWWGGMESDPFAQSHRKHPPMARFEDVHMAMPPQLRARPRVPLIAGSSPRRGGNWERQSSRWLECEKKSSGSHPGSASQECLAPALARNFALRFLVRTPCHKLQD